MPQWIGMTSPGRSARRPRPPASGRDGPRRPSAPSPRSGSGDVDRPELAPSRRRGRCRPRSRPTASPRRVADRLGRRAGGPRLRSWSAATARIWSAPIDPSRPPRPRSRLEPPPAEHPAEPARHDDRELLPELRERQQVEVVVVRVRHEDGVDSTPRPRGDGRSGAGARPGRSSGSVSDRTPSRSTKTVA